MIHYAPPGAPTHSLIITKSNIEIIFGPLTPIPDEWNQKISEIRSSNIRIAKNGIVNAILHSSSPISPDHSRDKISTTQDLNKRYISENNIIINDDDDDIIKRREKKPKTNHHKNDSVDVQTKIQSTFDSYPIAPMQYLPVPSKVSLKITDKSNKVIFFEEDEVEFDPEQDNIHDKNENSIVESNTKRKRNLILDDDDENNEHEKSSTNELNITNGESFELKQKSFRQSQEKSNTTITSSISPPSPSHNLAPSIASSIPMPPSLPTTAITSTPIVTTSTKDIPQNLEKKINNKYSSISWLID